MGWLKWAATTVCYHGLVKTLEWAATVSYHGLVKRLIRALVLKPISNRLLVGHSFRRYYNVPIQNWDLPRTLYFKSDEKSFIGWQVRGSGYYLKTSPQLWIYMRYVVSAVGDEHPIVIESLQMF